MLQNCTVEENNVKLPAGQLERKLYMEVAKSLELIGGKWKGGKIFAFVFPTDPRDLLNQIANGENRNLKKEYQFFATPANLADQLVQLAEIDNPNLLILEPSAGQGAIIEAILRKQPDALVHAYELMETNRMILLNRPCGKDTILLGFDFLQRDSIREPSFNRIIANPPFSNNQDIDHLIKMYECLKDNGIMVSITSESWANGSQSKQQEFKVWLEYVGAEIFDIPKGSFKKSGTMVGAKIIKIKKVIN